MNLQYVEDRRAVEKIYVVLADCGDGVGDHNVIDLGFVFDEALGAGDGQHFRRFSSRDVLRR